MIKRQLFCTHYQILNEREKVEERERGIGVLIRARVLDFRGDWN